MEDSCFVPNHFSVWIWNLFNMRPVWYVEKHRTSMTEVNEAACKKTWTERFSQFGSCCCVICGYLINSKERILHTNKHICYIFHEALPLCFLLFGVRSVWAAWESEKEAESRCLTPKSATPDFSLLFVVFVYQQEEKKNIAANCCGSIVESELHQDLNWARRAFADNLSW